MSTLPVRSATVPNPSAARPATALLTLLRHGQSHANRCGRFTGWDDVGLSRRGRDEAARAGRRLRAGRPVDICFTSMLGRAIDTAGIALASLGQPDLDVRHCWRLNERHYGALQGLTPWEAAARYGPLRVLRCRRGRRERPPCVADSDPRSPLHDPRYARVDPLLLPRAESLRDVEARVLPCWHERIAPELAAGRHVLVVSHRNLLEVLLRVLGEHAPLLGVSHGAPLSIPFATNDARIRGVREAAAAPIGAVA